ncbi:MAG TPA: hypothetical protein VFT82_00980 [Candidatus Paceibacterota bacterium]|nr:hypothetical protein [Candidatus Paceibacterota bacterium]
MKSILLLHHMGLGDHVMCHGIVREYAKRYSRVGLFALPHNAASVAFMYRDLPNVTVIKATDAEARKYMAENSGKPGALYDEAVTIGFEKLDRVSGEPLEIQFYKLAGVDFTKLWDSFRINRDTKREEALYEKAAPKKPYAFLHEDRSRSYNIKRSLIDQKLEIFIPAPELADNFCDYITAIERAAEIHVIDSSFMFLIDCLPYDNPNQKLFVHRYARENNEWQLPILKKDWHILLPEPGPFDFLRVFLEKLQAKKPTNSFIKRAIRAFFRKAGWTMGRPDRPNVEALVKRYKPLFKTKTASGDFPQLSADRPEILIWSFPARSRAERDAAEMKLASVGFSVRERHIFPNETCLVSRAV